MVSTAAIASGYVVNPAGQWSHQCDVIIYQPTFAPKLYADDNVQILPIECVYGVVEVSSSINKEKLRQDFKKLGHLKSMVRRGRTRYETQGHDFAIYGERNIPFGMILSFSLRACTLDDLATEFTTLCTNSEPFAYPNQVTVIDVGVDRRITFPL